MTPAWWASDDVPPAGRHYVKAAGLIVIAAALVGALAGMAVEAVR